MAKRRHKKRTHVVETPETAADVPRSMVIRVGPGALSNSGLALLVRDFRRAMEPHTATRLRERRANRLRDFVVMCGPLGVSHLFLFTQSQQSGNISLKLARTPRGPTITFRVLEYSLASDLSRHLRHHRSMNSSDVLQPPLLVLNGFKPGKPSTEELPQEALSSQNVEKVIVSMFQNIFPPLNPAKVQLGTIKRVFLVDKNSETGEISMRHYAIDVRDVDVSRNLKKLYRAKNNIHKPIPNLSQKEDIASLILDHDIGAYTSESEVDDDSIVKVRDETTTARKVPKSEETEEETKGPEENAAAAATAAIQQTKKKAIKLTELGPRLSLRLVKVEQDMCSGKVLYHEYIQKSNADMEALEKRHQERLKLKEKRRSEQEANLLRKKEVKEQKKQRKKQRKIEREAALSADAITEEGTVKSDDDSSSESSEDHYSDVPEDLDSDLYSDVD